MAASHSHVLIFFNAIQNPMSVFSTLNETLIQYASFEIGCAVFCSAPTGFCPLTGSMSCAFCLKVGEFGLRGRDSAILINIMSPKVALTRCS